MLGHAPIPVEQKAARLSIRKVTVKGVQKANGCVVHEVPVPRDQRAHYRAIQLVFDLAERKSVPVLEVVVPESQNVVVPVVDAAVVYANQWAVGPGVFEIAVPGRQKAVDCAVEALTVLAERKSAPGTRGLDIPVDKKDKYLV